MKKLSIILALLLLSMVILAPQAMAAGTLAGTSITNQAYGDYKDANNNSLPRVYSNKVTVTISQVAAISILPASVNATAVTNVANAYLVQLFNNGNAPDVQTFTFAQSGDLTNATYRVWYDVNNSHSHDAGDIELFAVNGIFTTTLPVPVDDDYDVILEVTLPTGSNGQRNIITATSVSAFDPTKTATGVYTTTLLAANVSAVKTHTPTGSPTKAKPGAEITYTVTLTNTGGTAATSAVFTDVMPTHMSYKPGSLQFSTNNGSTWTNGSDAADNDGIKYDAATRSIITDANMNGGTVGTGAGNAWKIRFVSTVNAGVANETPIVNQGSLTFVSGASGSFTITTNGDTLFVDADPAFTLTSVAMPKTGNPGDSITYAFTVTDTGNLSDTIDLTITSTQAWSWKLWVDANGDGIADATGGDYLITDTNNNGKLDTALLTQNGAINLLAVATIPVGSSNGTVDVVTVTGTSAAGLALTVPVTITANKQFTSTVTAPVISIVKAIANVQAPNAGANCTPTTPTTGAPCSIYPGSTLTYNVTATNSGAGNATGIVLTDITPVFMNYVAGTIKTGSTIGTLTARTDTEDADGAQYNAGTRAIIAPDGNTINLGPNGTWVVQYKLIVQ